VSKRCKLFEKFLLEHESTYEWEPFDEAANPFYLISTKLLGSHLIQYSFDMHSAKVWAGVAKPKESPVILKIDDAILTTTKGRRLTLEHIPQVLPYQNSGMVEHNANILGYDFLKWRLINAT
jgi:hypothetical protein